MQILLWTLAAGFVLAVLLGALAALLIWAFRPEDSPSSGQVEADPSVLPKSPTITEIML